MKPTPVSPKVLALAAGSAILAACGGRDSDEDLSTNIEPAPENEPSSGQAAPGEWRYTESDGYPWAGFEPPRSEAAFVISCQQGQVVFQYAGQQKEEADLSIQIAEGERNIDIAPNGAERPMSEGALPANDPFVRLIADSQKPMRIVVEARRMVLPMDVSYRRVVRTCMDGA